jgi:hypothetical protein
VVCAPRPYKGVSVDTPGSFLHCWYSAPVLESVEAVVGGRSQRAGRRLHRSGRFLVQGGFLATTVHARRRST